MRSVPFIERMANADHVLLAGAGGGFDVYAAIPLFVTLRAMGKQVTLANLSFTRLDETNARRCHGTCFAVTAEAAAHVMARVYFPEAWLATWLAARGEEALVYAFEKSGARPLAAAYRWLVVERGIDAVVLVDGGTDSLMRGDEHGLGTPCEDAASLVAAAQLDVAVKLLVATAFGVDTFHGVAHADVLAAIAELQAAGAFLGVSAVLPGSPEGDALIEAVEAANVASPPVASIVNNSLASAVGVASGTTTRPAGRPGAGCSSTR